MSGVTQLFWENADKWISNFHQSQKGYKNIGSLLKAVVEKPIEIYCRLNELQKDLLSW